MDDPLRAEDFRRAWPNALSVAMREANELTQKIEEATEKVQQANKNSVVIAELMPIMITELRAILKEESIKLLDGSRAELIKIREEVQETLTQVSLIEKTIAARTAELEKQTVKMTREREFLRIERERKKGWFSFLRGN